MLAHHIVIIEDDPLWQAQVQAVVEELGYAFQVFSTTTQAMEYLTQSGNLMGKPLCIITETVLSDGFSYDHLGQLAIDVPVIFVTSSVESCHFTAALALNTCSYFIKPVHPFTLKAALISIIRQRSSEQPVLPPPSLEVPIRYGVKRMIPLSEICWIRVEGNYSTIQTRQRKYVQKMSFPVLIPSLDQRFVRIHKSSIINKDYLSHVDLQANRLQVNKETFEIGRTYRRRLIEIIYSGELAKSALNA